MTTNYNILAIILLATPAWCNQIISTSTTKVTVLIFKTKRKMFFLSRVIFKQASSEVQHYIPGVRKKSSRAQHMNGRNHSDIAFNSFIELRVEDMAYLSPIIFSRIEKGSSHN